MRGSTRLLGIATIVAVLFGSLLYTAERLTRTEESTRTVTEGETILGASLDGDRYGDDPNDGDAVTDEDRIDNGDDSDGGGEGLEQEDASLGFTTGFPSGVYRVRAGAFDPDGEGAVPADGDGDARNERAPGDDDEDLYSISAEGAATTSLSGTVSLLGLAYRGPVEPGLYATGPDAEDCQYELRRTIPGGGDRVIGHDRLLAGRMLVTLNEVEPDAFISTRGCGDWFPWSPPETPLKHAGDGDYWLGDLAEGVWDVPNDCYWEKVVAFRGADLADVIDNGTGPEQLVVDEGTVGVRVRNCHGQDMVRVSAAPPYEPPVERDRRYGRESG